MQQTQLYVLHAVYCTGSEKKMLLASDNMATSSDPVWRNILISKIELFR